jgi:hypothetical protein
MLSRPFSVKVQASMCSQGSEGVQESVLGYEQSCLGPCAVLGMMANVSDRYICNIEMSFP